MSPLQRYPVLETWFKTSVRNGRADNSAWTGRQGPEAVYIVAGHRMRPYYFM
jgi:hypothetical protein